jgi:hypothetical protein
MDFNQIIEFSVIEDKKDKIFVNLLSNIDCRTYELLAQKADININFLKDVPSLGVLYK